jgi:hypothetical protein
MGTSQRALSVKVEQEEQIEMQIKVALACSLLC